MDMIENGMYLPAALLVHSRAVAQDAGQFNDISADVLVERFFQGTAKAGGLLANSLFNVAVIRRGDIELSEVCQSYKEVEQFLQTEVHGGRALLNGAWWFPVESRHLLRSDKLRYAIQDISSDIHHHLNHLYQMVDAQDRGGQLLPPALAKGDINHLIDCWNQICSLATQEEE